MDHYAAHEKNERISTGIYMHLIIAFIARSLLTIYTGSTSAQDIVKNSGKTFQFLRVGPKGVGGSSPQSPPSGYAIVSGSS